jgi:hypothetical protein
VTLTAQLFLSPLGPELAALPGVEYLPPEVVARIRMEGARQAERIIRTDMRMHGTAFAVGAALDRVEQELAGHVEGYAPCPR